MTSRFWFLTYNIILIPLLSVVVKILASYHSKINDDDIRYADGMNSSVQDGDCIQIVPSVAGGR